MNRKQQFKREDRNARRLLLTKRITPTEYGDLLAGVSRLGYGLQSLVYHGRYHRGIGAIGSIPQRVVLTGWSKRQAARLME